MGGLDMTTGEPYRLLVGGFKDILDQAEALLHSRATITAALVGRSNRRAMQ